MNVKVMLGLAVLFVLGGAYKFVIAAPAKAPEHKAKIEGELYVLPKDFLLNLRDGRYAKVGVAFVMKHGAHAAPAGGGHGAAVKPPEGFGPLPQEAAARAIVTDVISGTSDTELTTREGRERLKKAILKGLKRQTDVEVEEVLLTDVTVQ